MQSMRRGFVVVLALIVLASLALAGCSKENNGKNRESQASPSASTAASSQEAASASPEATEPPIDTSKEVNLKGYLLGEAPAGMPAVMAELNKRLKTDINATFEVDYLGWSDYAAKYPLILTNSSGTDWIFSANWINFVEHATKGAFKALTEEQIQKYMPEYYASVNKEALKAGSIDGKIYMLPAPSRAPNIKVAIIRGDLRKKYNVPEIKKLSDLEPYFAAIKANEPNMIPAALSSNSVDTELLSQLIADQGQSQIQIAYGPGIYFTLEDSKAKLLTVEEEPLKSQVLAAADTMKKWYDAGYITHDYFSNKVNSLDAFDQGKSAFATANTISVRKILSSGNEKGYDIEIIPFIDAEGRASAGPWISGGVSIPAGAKNVERTLMALDRIMSVPDYNRLVYLGIEGTNYVINGDGKLALPEGVTAETNTYPQDAAGFWFSDPRQIPPDASWSDDYVALLKQVEEQILYTSPLEGLNFNFDNLKTEVSALGNVQTQYFLPFKMGSVRNSEEAFNTFVQKAKLAGMDKIREEAQQQIDAYVQSK
ncbi:DUF3502 domain-containing protein [Cohnella sp. GCM10020058]|uniref:DUF3502 domain-containing protein n=1 Tax=Cohnella sp. GCM10020058 TaxID=3317330 RepID=UPI00363B6964